MVIGWTQKGTEGEIGDEKILRPLPLTVKMVGGKSLSASL